jgi:cysteinyl-tRNA synthetase
MSKSSGEFLTVSLLESKGYDPLAYRYFCLQSHYRKSLVFTYENLDNATAAFEKLIARIAALDPADGEVDAEKFDSLKAGFVEAMDNDLNTSLAVTALFDVLKADTNGATKLALIENFDQVLCLDLIKKATEKREENAMANADPELIAKIDALVAERTAAKKERNFARADEIRAELTAMGVILVDTKEGTTYKFA